VEDPSAGETRPYYFAQRTKSHLIIRLNDMVVLTRLGVLAFQSVVVVGAQV